MVLAEIARVEWLDIEMSFSDFRSTKGICWPANTPFLRHLKVKDVSPAKDSPPLVFTTFIAPSLEYFECDCFLVKWTPGAAPVSLTTLFVVNL